MEKTMSFNTSEKKEELEDNEAALVARNLVKMSVPSMVLKTLIELGVLEMIKKAGQLSAEEIAAELHATHSQAAATLDRLLRLMASYSVLSFSPRPGPDGRTITVYGLSPVGKFLTNNDDGTNFAGFSLFLHDAVFLRVWEQLKDAIVEGGIPFNRTYGTGIFEYIGKDPKFGGTVSSGSMAHSMFVTKKIIDTYKGFEGLSSLVDVGGSTGADLSLIVSTYPTIKGINYDLPHIIENAPPYPGVEHVEGDMYESIPKADGIFMKWIIHTTTDEQCVRLLKNCHAALPEHGKVIICEKFVPDTPETNEAARGAFILDTIMLTFSGGKERTKADFEALGRQSGFNTFRVVCCAYDLWVMEFLKN